MNSRVTLSRLAALGLLAGLVGRAAVLQAEDASSAVARGVAAELAAMNGRQMYVMTDKPLYHPGESVWFRAWELSVKTLQGTDGDHGITFQLIDPKGAKVAEKRVLCQGGMATNDFTFGAELAGGLYTLRAVSDLGGTVDKTVTLSAYELPRVKKTLEFTRKSYAPGDEVTLQVSLVGASGEALMGARVAAVITIDGAEIARFFVPVDVKGKGTVRFQLPPRIARGDGLVTLQVDAGGITESAQRRIPIVLDQVDLALFPEGGDLVNGLSSRVYVAAHDPTGKPAEVEGDVLDDRGAFVAHFKSFHGGMARFSMTPEKGRSYAVKLKKQPAAGANAWALPRAKDAGCVLQSEDDYRSAHAAIRVKVRCTEAQKVTATAVLRERLLTSVGADVAPGAPSTIALPVPRGAQGAVRVTLFDAASAPVAERLVYRGLGDDLRVSVTADRPSYAPRDKVTLTVKTTDLAGKPVSSDLAIAVADDVVLNVADDRSAHLLAALYLESEMPGQKIAEPNFYFSSDAKAPEALDLLLGTQGWRRFEWKLVQRRQAVAGN